MIAGYGFFREAWGTEDQQIVTMLGLAYIFKEFDLRAIIGNRYTDNTLTAKFMGRFGFKDCGEIPCFQLRETKLVPLVVSALMREDFEQYVADFLVKQYRAEEVEEPLILPLLTDTPREAIDAQVQRLAAGEIAVVYFPYTSTYVPGIPDGMDLKVIAQGENGAGIYFFNPRMVEEAQVGPLKIVPQPRTAPPVAAPVIDVQWPEVDEVIPEAERAAPFAVEDWVVVQAFDANGALLHDKLVERTAEAVAVQFEVFERQFPGCRCEVVAAIEDDIQPELPF
jgi:hypothetical protein